MFDNFSYNNVFIGLIHKGRLDDVRQMFKQARPKNLLFCDQQYPTTHLRYIHNSAKVS